MPPPESNRLPQRSLQLGSRMRLHGARQFLAVYRAAVSRHAGPMIVYTMPNDLDFTRLGLTVSRRVGTAARRNRIKRLLREAYRLHQHDLPSGYDVVVRVKPHEPMDLKAYAELLAATLRTLDERWKKTPQPTPRTSPRDDSP
jgi:ribonuclease P protein component